MSAPVIEIPLDVLETADAVLGGAPLPSGHPGRADAFAAMHALGYGSAYIGEQLSIKASTVPNFARKLGIPMDRTRGVVDHMGVELVVQGVPLRLRGRDLDAALARLAEDGRTAAECAKLLRTGTDIIHKRADELGLALTEDTSEGCWWVAYTDRRRRKET